MSSSLGDASSFLGDASSFLGDASSFLGDASSFLGDVSSFLGGASSFLGDASSQHPLTMNSSISLNSRFDLICNPRCTFVIASNYFGISRDIASRNISENMCHIIYCFITKLTSPISSVAKNLIKFYQDSLYDIPILSFYKAVDMGH